MGGRLKEQSSARTLSDGIIDYELQGSGVEGAFMDTNVLTGLISTA